MYFAKFFNAFVKPRNLNFSRNKLYIWNLQITRFKMIYDMFVLWEFKIFSNFQKWPKIRLLRENCSLNREMKIFSQYFWWFGLSAKLPFRRCKICWGDLSLSKIVGGGAPRTPHPFILQNCVYNAISSFFKRQLQENYTSQHRCPGGLVDKKQWFQSRVWSSSPGRSTFS